MREELILKLLSRQFFQIENLSCLRQFFRNIIRQKSTEKEEYHHRAFQPSFLIIILKYRLYVIDFFFQKVKINLLSININPDFPISFVFFIVCCLCLQHDQSNLYRLLLLFCLFFLFIQIFYFFFYYSSFLFVSHIIFFCSICFSLFGSIFN